MKKTIKLVIVLVMAITGWQTAFAQKTKSSGQAEKAAAIKRMVESGTYVFKANYVNPQRGGSHALTSDYDLAVSKDTVTAFLPYFGRAYAVNYGSTEGGIKFKTTHFDYNVQSNKKGGWDVMIRPKDRDASDMRDVQTLRLSISANGYASLNVSSTNRDPIMFQGNIEGKR